MMSRSEAKKHACPKCGADVGKPCFGKSGERLSIHRERYAAVPRLAPDAPRPTRRAHRTGYVYFIANYRVNAVKIGFTANNPYKRLKDLQTGAASSLSMMAYIPGTMADEAEWHERHKDNRVAGEWFALTKRLEREILSLEMELVE